MAIHSNSSGDLHRNAGAFLSNGSDWTAMLWVRILDTPTAGKYHTYFALYNVGFTRYVELTSADTNQLELDVNQGAFQFVLDATLSVNTWYHIALTYDHTSHVFTIFVNGVAGSTLTADFSAITFSNVIIANDTTVNNWGNQDSAYFRTWQSKLTATEIQTEMASRSAVKAAPFEDDWIILTSDITDHSGNARNLSSTATVSNQYGPIWPSNGLGNLGGTDISVAKDISVGFSETIDPKDAAYIWYKHVGQPGEIVLGAWGFGGLGGTYIPVSSVRSPDGSTVYLGVGAATNVPLQIPVYSGNVYYFRVATNQVIATGFTLTFKLDLAPNSNAPIGSIGVNDDTGGFSLALLDQTTGFPLQFVNGIANGESVAVTVAGIVSMTNENTSPVDQVRIYSPALQNIATLIPFPGVKTTAIACDMAGKFYYANASDGTIKAYDTAGNFLQSWTIALNNIANMAVIHDNTILYYISSAVNQPVKRFDLVNNIALSDLVAGVATYGLTKSCLLCLSDGSVIVAYYGGGTGRDMSVRRYNAAGTLLNTYSLGDVANDTRMFMAIDDPNSFWIWTKNLTGGTLDGKSRFRNIKCSDGSILHDINLVQQYESGVYNSLANATPDRFGHSESCGVYILRVALSPTSGRFSGVYILVPHRPHDTVYTSILPGNPPITTTQDVKIP